MGGFDRAQAQYDAHEPPGEPLCLVCDGEGKVVVAVVAGCEGEEVRWPEEKWEKRPEIDCPFCT